MKLKCSLNKDKFKMLAKSYFLNHVLIYKVTTFGLSGKNRMKKTYTNSPMISQTSKVDFKLTEQDLAHREYEHLHIVQKTSFLLSESSKLTSQKGWMCMFWLARNRLVLLNINKPFLYALVLVIFSCCFP